MLQDALKSQGPVPIRFKTGLDERLKIVLDGMPIGVCWASIDDGSIQFMNRKIIEMLGYTPAEVPTLPELVRVAFADPQQRAAATLKMVQIIGSHSLVEMDIPSQEAGLISKDGMRRTISFGGVVAPEAGWIVATFLDLSERAKASS
jgi:PAS domain-containing protein